jgi:hypothetical protein
VAAVMSQSSIAESIAPHGLQPPLVAPLCRLVCQSHPYGLPLVDLTNLQMQIYIITFLKGKKDERSGA